MSYYSGDFYQGDFYQGDPGFFSFLGKAAKTIGGFLPGVGGVVGRVAGKVIKSRTGQAIIKHPTLSAAATAGTIGTMGGAATTRLATRVGAAPVGPIGVRRMGARAPRIPGMRHHRRMRVTNVKALRRAIRRAKGFEKLARKVMHFTSPRKVHGRAVFRVRRRKQ